MASDKDDADLESRGSHNASPQAIAWALVTAPACCPTRDRKSLLDAGFITRFHDDHAYTSDGRRCGKHLPALTTGLRANSRVIYFRFATDASSCGVGLSLDDTLRFLSFAAHHQRQSRISGDLSC
jgi:hypothetical protein